MAFLALRHFPIVIREVLDRSTINLRDQVSFSESRVIGSTPGFHLGNDQPFSAIQAQALRNLRGHGLNGQSQLTLLPARSDLGVFHLTDGDRKRHLLAISQHLD